MRRLTLDEFTARLASSDPTPGGGSAAAVVGAFGAALVAMLARLSSGRGGDDAMFGRTAETMDEARAVLLDLAASDAAAYDAVMAARRKPRTTDEEKLARTRAIQAAMREAAQVPLDVAGRALSVLEAAHEILPTANPNAASDGGVAILLAEASVRGALANVRINLASIKDEEFLRATSVRVAELEARAGVLKDEGMAMARGWLK